MSDYRQNSFMHERIKLGIIVAALAFLLIVPVVHAEDALDWYMKGQDAITVGRYMDAIRYFDNALLLNKNYADAFAGKAVAYNKLGRYGDALSEADKALAQKMNADALDARASALFGLGRYEEAIVAYDLFFSVRTNVPEAYYFKGVAYEKLNMTQQAVVAYDKCLFYDPQNLNAWNRKGLALLLLGKYQDALDAFGHCTQITIKSAEVWNNKGLAYAALGDYNNAIECFKKALGIDPAYTDAEQNLDKAFLRKPFFTPAVTVSPPVLPETTQMMPEPTAVITTQTLVQTTVTPPLASGTITESPAAARTTYASLSPVAVVISVLAAGMYLVYKKQSDK
jgi:tetratricopeptide (TPR) repeat protein